jgi:hypothetical protein
MKEYTKIILEYDGEDVEDFTIILDDKSEDQEIENDE